MTGIGRQLLHARVLWVWLGALLPGVELDAKALLGTLAGTVRDSSGGAPPGVSVTLVPQPVGTLRSTITDAEGPYEIGALPAGDYRLEAVLAGFSSREALITITAGDTRTLDLTLDVSPFTETVTVTVTRTEQDRSTVPNAVSVIEGDVIQAFQRRASPAETFAGIPGFYVENRRNFSLSSLPPSQPRRSPYIGELSTTRRLSRQSDADVSVRSVGVATADLTSCDQPLSTRLQKLQPAGRGALRLHPPQRQQSETSLRREHQQRRTPAPLAQRRPLNRDRPSPPLVARRRAGVRGRKGRRSVRALSEDRLGPGLCEAALWGNGMLTRTACASCKPPPRRSRLSPSNHHLTPRGEG